MRRYCTWIVYTAYQIFCQRSWRENSLFIYLFPVIHDLPFKLFMRFHGIWRWHSKVLWYNTHTHTRANNKLFNLTLHFLYGTQFQTAFPYIQILMRWLIHKTFFSITARLRRKSDSIIPLGRMCFCSKYVYQTKLIFPLCVCVLSLAPANAGWTGTRTTKMTQQRDINHNNFDAIRQTQRLCIYYPHVKAKQISTRRRHQFINNL